MGRGLWITLDLLFKKSVLALWHQRQSSREAGLNREPRQFPCLQGQLDSLGFVRVSKGLLKGLGGHWDGVGVPQCGPRGT